jgi:hypothetical protein
MMRNSFYRHVYSMVWILSHLCSALASSSILNDKRLYDEARYNDSETIDKKAITFRKEIRKMSSKELDRYFDALWTYKLYGRQDGLDYFKTYDDLVAQHALASYNTTVDQAHQYGAFLVWHGVYVRELELAIQSIDRSVSVPYWDWTIDSALSTPSSSEIFTSKYFGASNASSPYEVIDGRMAYWTVSSNPLAYVWWQSPVGLFLSLRLLLVRDAIVISVDWLL